MRQLKRDQHIFRSVDIKVSAHPWKAYMIPPLEAQSSRPRPRCVFCRLVYYPQPLPRLGMSQDDARAKKSQAASLRRTARASRPRVEWFLHGEYPDLECCAIRWVSRVGRRQDAWIGHSHSGSLLRGRTSGDIRAVRAHGVLVTARGSLQLSHVVTAHRWFPDCKPPPWMRPQLVKAQCSQTSKLTMNISLNVHARVECPPDYQECMATLAIRPRGFEPSA